MSRENLEVVRRLYEAVNRRDVPAVLELMTPDVELRTTVETYHGAEGVEAFLADVERTFEDYTTTPSDLTTADDRVVADIHQRGRGRGSGIDVDHAFTHVLTVQDGRVTSLRAFTSRREALESVGPKRLA